MLLNQAEHQDVLFLIGQNFASIVHELRNPLTSLTGFVQLIRIDVADKAEALNPLADYIAIVPVI